MPKIYAKIKYKHIVKSSISDDAATFDLTPILDDFAKSGCGFMPSVMMLVENNVDPKSLPEVANFYLTEDEKKSGVIKIENVNGDFLAVCDGIFQLDVKSEYVEIALNKNTSWAIGGINVSEEITGWEFAYGSEVIEADMKDFLGTREYSYFNKRLKENITVRYMLIDVETAKTLKEL